MPDEDRVGHVERPADLQYVVGVAVEAAVAFAIVCPEVRRPGADVVEEHHSVVVLEGRRHEAPHVLVATEAVREEHGASVRASADL